VVAHMWRDELRAKMDRGDPFVLLEALAPRYYQHSHSPEALARSVEPSARQGPRDGARLAPRQGGRDSTLLLGRGVTHLPACRP